LADQVTWLSKFGYVFVNPLAKEEHRFQGDLAISKTIHNQAKKKADLF
jgi:hypothetical protein